MHTDPVSEDIEIKKVNHTLETRSVKHLADLKQINSIPDEPARPRFSTEVDGSWWDQLQEKEKRSESGFDTTELFRPSENIKNIRAVRKFSLLITDIFSMVLVVFLAWEISAALRPYLGSNIQPGILPSSFSIQLVMFVLPVLLMTVMSLRAGHYQLFKPIWTEAKEILSLSTSVIATVAIVLFLLKGHFSRLWFVSFWMLMIFVVPAGRYLCKAALMRFHYWFLPVVIYGTGNNAKKIADTIGTYRWLGLRVEAFVRTNAEDSLQPEVPESFIINSITDERLDILRYGEPHYIFAPESQQEYEDSKLLLNHVNAISKAVTISPPFYGLPLAGAEILSVPNSDSMLIRLSNNLENTHNKIIKRFFDIFVSLIALTLLSPLFLVIGLLVRRDGGPVFYKQKRIGRNKKIFECLKFRSMALQADELLEEHLKSNPEARKEWEQDFKLRNDPRITSVGKFLRKTSLDELPQLWNVLCNDMSLVGPRPIVYSEQERYGTFLPYYMSSSPGITGMWQVSGRNDTTYEERVNLDVWYARNWSFWLDLVIIARTIPSVVRQQGAY